MLPFRFGIKPEESGIKVAFLILIIFDLSKMSNCGYGVGGEERKNGIQKRMNIFPYDLRIEPDEK